MMMMMKKKKEREKEKTTLALVSGYRGEVVDVGAKTQEQN